MTEKDNQPRIRNFCACGSDSYNLTHKIKIYPITSSGTHGIIRDKNGAAIGGGNTIHVRDSHKNHYDLLITPALYEDLIKSIHPPFGRSIPGKLFIEVRLTDFPDDAIDKFEWELFSDRYGEEWNENLEEYDEVFYSAPFKKHEHHKWKPKTYILALKTKSQYHCLRSTLDQLIQDYHGQSINITYGIIAPQDPIVKLQYIFTFPEPWIVNRVFSPIYWYRGIWNRSDDGFEYAWYYGRYGVFEDWGDSTDYPHKYEHGCDRWDKCQN